MPCNIGKLANFIDAMQHKHTKYNYLNMCKSYTTQRVNPRAGVSCKFRIFQELFPATLCLLNPPTLSLYTCIYTDIDIPCPRLGAEGMAAQVAFGTDFYDRSILRPKHRAYYRSGRPVIRIGPKGYEIRPIHSASSLGQSIAYPIFLRFSNTKNGTFLSIRQLCTVVKFTF